MNVLFFKICTRNLVSVPPGMPCPNQTSIFSSIYRYTCSNTCTLLSCSTFGATGGGLGVLEALRRQRKNSAWVMIWEPYFISIFHHFQAKLWYLETKIYLYVQTVCVLNSKDIWSEFMVAKPRRNLGSEHRNKHEEFYITSGVPFPNYKSI